MATVIYAYGNSGEITVPANEKIAVLGYSPIQVYQKVGYPNVPSQLELLTTTTAGTEYVSAAFASGAVIVLENTSASDGFYEVGSDPSVSEPTPDISAAATPWTATGLAAAQGGSMTLKGGTSSTSGNAGGAAAILGGQPGATGIGGAATVTGAAGGATSGAGGAASVTGGVGTAGNAAGGAASATGGAGQGSAAGGAGSVGGGAGGATGTGGAATVIGGAGGATSGKGGAANITGGAGTNGNASGGSVILQPGAKNGSGLDGGVFNRGTFQLRKQGTPETATDTATLTVAQVLSGILLATPTAAANYTTPTGTDLQAALPTDIATGDSFDLTIVNLGGSGDDITILAGAGVTITGGGSMVVTVAAPSQGTFRWRRTGANTFQVYRIA